MSDFGVLLFHTNSAVMQAEALLSKANFKIKLIPTPRELSSDCGVALRFDWERNADVRTLLNSSHIDVADIHHLPPRG